MDSSHSVCMYMYMLVYDFSLVHGYIVTTKDGFLFEHLLAMFLFSREVSFVILLLHSQ